MNVFFFFSEHTTYVRVVSTSNSCAPLDVHAAKPTDHKAEAEIPSCEAWHWQSAGTSQSCTSYKSQTMSTVGSSKDEGRKRKA